MANEARFSVKIFAENLTKAGLASVQTDLRKMATEAKSMIHSQLAGAFSLAAIGLSLKRAVDEANDYRQSQLTLASAALSTGARLQDLQTTSQQLGERFKLDGALANRYTESVARLAGVAGDLGEVGPAAAAFLNLGAARGMSAAESLEAIENAFVGVYRSAQRVLGQNVPDLFEREARASGTTVAALSEQRKAHILLEAAVRNSVRAGDAYGAWLRTAAGQAAIASMSIQQAYETLGIALEPARVALASFVAYAAGLFSEFLDLWGTMWVQFAVWDVKIEAAIRVFMAHLGAEIEAGLATALTFGFGGLGQGLTNALLRASAERRREAEHWRGAAPFAEGAPNEAFVAGMAGPPTPRKRAPAGRRPSLIDQSVVTGLRRYAEEQAELAAKTVREAVAEGQRVALTRLAVGRWGVVSPAEAQWERGGLPEPGPVGPDRALAESRAALEAAGPSAEDLGRLNEQIAQMVASTTRVRSLWLEVGVAMADAQGHALTLAQTIAGALQAALGDIADAIGSAMAAFIQGSQQAGAAFAASMRAALASVARYFAQYFVGRAAGAVADALLGGPLKAGAWASAAKFMLAAGLMGALGGIAGGGAGGGGAGGAGGMGYEAAAGGVMGAGRGDVTIVLQGGRFLDLGDPRQLEAFRRAMEEFAGRRVVVREG